MTQSTRGTSILQDEPRRGPPARRGVLGAAPPDRDRARGIVAGLQSMLQRAARREPSALRVKGLEAIEPRRRVLVTQQCKARGTEQSLCGRGSVGLQARQSDRAAEITG